MEKVSFVIYKSFYEPIKLLNDEQLGKLFRSIFEYQLNKETKIDEDIKMAFAFFKNQFDLDEIKYNEKCEKNKQSAKIRWNNSTANECERIQTNAINADKDKDKDKDKEKDKEKDKDILITTTNNIYEYFEKNYGRPLSPIEVEKINCWLLLFEEEMIKQAIKISIMNNKKTFSYLNGILNNWQSCGYKTLQEVINNENNTKTKKETPKKDLYEYDWLEENNEEESQ